MKKFNKWLELKENESSLKERSLEVKFSIKKIIQEVSNNKVVYDKLKIMERKFDTMFMYIDLHGEGFLSSLYVLLEEIEQYTIAQIEDYLNTKQDRYDIIKYYPGFSDSDFILFVEKLKKIIKAVNGFER